MAPTTAAPKASPPEQTAMSEMPVSLPKRLSPSAASTFDQCPRRWRFRYIENRPEPSGEAALVGSFVHRVLELLLAEAPQERTIERAKQLARDTWPETAARDDFSDLSLDPQAERAFRWKGWYAIEGLWTLEDPAGIQVHSTEQRVEVQLDGVPFVGIIDRVEQDTDGLVVTDYKSGRPPRARFRADKLHQVLLYAAALRELDHAPTRARLLYLGSTVVETDATDDAVAEAVGQLRGTWDQLVDACEHDTFVPKTGPLCGWCPHLLDCPEGRAEVEQRIAAGRIRDDAPAVALVA